MNFNKDLEFDTFTQAAIFISLFPTTVVSSGFSEEEVRIFKVRSISLFFAFQSNVFSRNTREPNITSQSPHPLTQILPLRFANNSGSGRYFSVLLCFPKLGKSCVGRFHGNNHSTI
ncbi:hypothetical protein L6452_00018 [Arctium lappa]|uniref:Uncharacterized protein n=1 Tax=Arctium lappa TaxID=4217 RepID=A0ACB9FCY9_ARCLA|nr:hypothetical protein L6452_00018 [Arctium lappa]